MEIKKDWITEYGYRALILFINDSHYCGYVIVPKEHKASGIDYYTWAIAIDDTTDEFISKIKAIKAVNSIQVHGGLTYADSKLHGVEDIDGWVFGFDANHHGDKSLLFERSCMYSTFKDVDYMANECEKLSKQLFEIGKMLWKTHKSNG